MNERNDKSPHILNTSANLLGLCFIVLTSRNLLDIKNRTIIDEITAGAILFFMTSCILSFISMRNKKILSDTYEKIADIIFFAGLFLLFLTAVLITLDIIK